MCAGRSSESREIQQTEPLISKVFSFCVRNRTRTHYTPVTFTEAQWLSRGKVFIIRFEFNNEVCAFLAVEGQG